MEPTFDTIDVNNYTRISNVSLATLIALRKALAKVAPEQSNEQIERAKQELTEAIDAGQAELLQRRRLAQTPAYGPARPFDGAVDALWGCAKARLEALRAFEHPGLDALVAAGGPRGLRIARNRRRAERAGKLIEIVFGDEGLRFTKLRYREQLVVMNTMLELIDENDIADQIDNLVGLDIIASLRDCQELYEDLVADRLAGEGLDSKAIGALRRRLSRAIVQYNVAVFGLLDREQPKTLEMVTRALRPVLVLRQHIAEGRPFVDSNDDALATSEPTLEEPSAEAS